MSILPLLAWFATSANAATLTVCQTGCNFINIDSAVNAAMAGDSIAVDPGWYFEPTMSVFNDLTIYSTGGPGLTTISFANEGFRVQDPVIFSLSGFTVDGGVTGKRAVRNTSGGSIFIDDCVFQFFNQSNKGNVVFQRQGGATTITNSSFLFNGIGNCCDEGGAVFASSGLLTVQGSYFEGNASGSGGALGGRDASVLIEDTQFVNNTADHDGGAIWIENGDLTLTRVRLHNNTALDWGGAVWTSGAINTLDNVDMCANDAKDGGGLYFNANAGLLDVTNGRFWDNSARDGGAIYGNSFNLATLFVSQSTFANNTGFGGIYTRNSTDLYTNDSLFVDHLDFAIKADGFASSTNNAYWNNNGNSTAGPDATDILTDPMLIDYTPGDGLCDDVITPGPTASLLDSGTGSDLDGSPSMPGANGGLGADPALWLDADGDGQIAMWDCDDANPLVTRGIYWTDNDGDGLGDPNTEVTSCALQANWVQNGDDCDDLDGSVGAAQLWYADQDNDGFGDAFDPGQLVCRPAGTWVSISGDCDDADLQINPAAAEVCDGVDNNCSGLIDDDDPTIDPGLLTYFYPDLDLDGYGSAFGGQRACFQPIGASTNDGDCNDTNPTINPVAPETCGDGVDSNCDGQGGPNGDDDNDGLTWSQEITLGASDCSPDSDGDGLDDATEFARGDTDGDGLADLVDPDDDNDGISTAIELTIGSNPISNDTDNDGITDDVETPGGLVDTDGDGVPDILDTDDDGDTIPTLQEGGGDVDGDSVPNYLDLDSDGDGNPDAIELTGDVDGDGVLNFLDANDAVNDNPDRDNDGVSNDDELAQGTDPDNPDSDGDGVPDGDELGDSDNDGLIDAIDNDDDNDGIPTLDEGTGDTDGDGLPDRIDVDDDGDGIDTADEGTDDLDGDGIPNYLDTDSDGDGVADSAERADRDGDGVPDYLQAGGDGVGPSKASGSPSYGFGCNTGGAPGTLWWALLPLSLMRRRR